jgi:hypothetical protein
LGTFTKESFIPFSLVFLLAWWLVTRKHDDQRAQGQLWIVGAGLAELLVFMVLQWRLGGRIVSPAQFAAALHRNHDYLRHFASSLWDRNFWYIFLWLLPMGIPRLKNLPDAWLVPTLAASAMAFVLDAYYGGAPGTVGRALFSVAGPVLALSSATLLVGAQQERRS